MILVYWLTWHITVAKKLVTEASDAAVNFSARGVWGCCTGNCEQLLPTPPTCKLIPFRHNSLQVKLL